MTLDRLIEICEQEYRYGMQRANYYNYEAGYAAAFRIVLNLAQALKLQSEERHQ